MQKNIIFLILFVFLTTLYGNSSAFAKNKTTNTQTKEKKWYGILTLDSYPVKSCEVVKIGENITIDYVFSRGTINTKKEENAFYKDIIRTITPNSEELGMRYRIKKEVQNKGFNAVLGAKIIFSNNFHLWENGTIVNSTIGGGIGFGFIYGTPVLIKCKN